MNLRSVVAIAGLAVLIIGGTAGAWWIVIGAIVAYVAWMFVRGPISRDRDRDNLPSFHPPKD